jgi:hypothetical protein
MRWIDKIIVEFHRVEPPYTSPEGCRLVWRGIDEDDEHVVILNRVELNQLVEILKKNTTGKIELEDQVSRILVNSDITQFELEHGFLVVKTAILQRLVLEYARVPHQPQTIHFNSREFYHQYEDTQDIAETKKGPNEIIASTPQQSLLQAITSFEPHKPREELLESDLFRVFATRRSTRKFERTKVEEWKVDKILALQIQHPLLETSKDFKYST